MNVNSELRKQALELSIARHAVPSRSASEVVKDAAEFETYLAGEYSDEGEASTSSS